MPRKVINSILFLPFALFILSLDALSIEKKDNLDKVLEENSNIPFNSYQEIEQIVLNNP